MYSLCKPFKVGLFIIIYNKRKTWVQVCMILNSMINPLFHDFCPVTTGPILDCFYSYI